MKNSKSAIASILLLTSVVSVTLAGLAESSLAQSRSRTPVEENSRVQDTLSTTDFVFEIHVAGPEGGELIINDESRSVGSDASTDVPACGIRWQDPVAWYWLDHYSVLDIPNNEIDVDELSFIGPYQGCGLGLYEFSTPATPDEEIPEGATTLVVQVNNGDDWDWLDANGRVIPTGDGPSICEISDCDRPDDFTTP